MKKIVINACYGGFGLSKLAIKRLAELQGKKCYFFKFEPPGSKYIPISDLNPDTDESRFWFAFTVPNPDEVLGSGKEWQEMTIKERRKYNKRSKEISLCGSDLKRDDPLLVQVVEELGEKVNGQCAELEVIKIPDGVEWQIEEHDGYEHIAEKHRTWGK